jgi:hypothetical protein
MVTISLIIGKTLAYYITSMIILLLDLNQFSLPPFNRKLDKYLNPIFAKRRVYDGRQKINL